jgi:hypothetical protein
MVAFFEHVTIIYIKTLESLIFASKEADPEIYFCLFMRMQVK